MEPIGFDDLLLLKSLAEEVRDQTLSRSRQQDAKRAVEILEREMEAAVSRNRARVDGSEVGNWLEPYFEAALASNLCIKITCWCGSLPFKTGLVALASNGREDVGRLDFKTREKIVAALARVRSPCGNFSKVEGFEQAAMAVIYYLWSVSPQNFDHKIEPMLNGTWASSMLKRMQAHYGSRRVRT